MLVLLPLPVLLAVFPASDDSELGAVGIGLLIAFWTVIQSGLILVGVGLRRLSESGLLSRC
jgi:hypothetical protein